MNLKVANIILEGRFGGPQNRILQVAERLKEYGIETVVIMPKKDSETFYSKLIEKNIQVKRLNLHRLTKQIPHLIGYIVFFIPELFSLYKYLKAQKIKLVHCNNPWQFKGILAAKMASAKTIWHLNSTDTPTTIKVIFKMLAGFCDGFIVASDRTRRYFFSTEGLNTKKSIVIQAPVDTSHYNPEHVVEDKDIANRSGTKITTVGIINPSKGIEYFIKMANILCEKYKDLLFYIVGPHFDSQKGYFERLNLLIKGLHLNGVFFYGKSDNVASVLKATDIYVCSSVAEASPTAVWEAMAMEKAIVSTDVGDVNVYVQDGVNGFVVPPRDAEALAEKVSILIEDKNLRTKFGKLARATAVKELDIAICADKHRRFYLEVLNND